MWKEVHYRKAFNHKIYIKGTHIRKDLGVAAVRRANQEDVLAGQHGQSIV